MGLVSRAIWQVNRSPLRHLVKTGVSTWHLGEKRERRRQARLLSVSPAEKAKADGLNADGYAIVTELMDPQLQQEFADAGVAKLEEMNASGAKQHRKKFLLSLLESDMKDGRISADNIFVRYALQQPVINIVSSALGEVPSLSYLVLTYSLHTVEELSTSQLWHRDHDDVRVIKLFSYLTDVEEEGDGPFTFLPRQSTEKFGYPLLKSHFPDDRVFGRVPRSDIKMMKAPRLTSFIVDTSRCLHMGSRMAPGHGRLLYTASFISFPSMFPGAKRPFISTPANSPLEKLVMGVN